MGMSKGYIALGGNLGDVPASFHEAREALNKLAGDQVIASSLLYRSPPLGPAGQPDYFNAVMAIETSMTPLALLEVLQGIETRAGRVRGERWGARTLDLDIISFNDMTLESERLTLPHPEMHLRQFVLRPLCDLDVNWQHPRLKQSAGDLLAELLQRGEEPLREGCAW